MTKRVIRILCVDDHSFLVEGLQARFRLEDDLDCVGSLPSAENLIRQARELKPDIVLLDIEMPGPDPFETAKDLTHHCPATRTIFLSAYVRDHYISAAMELGAWGYFSKADETEAIIEGIRKVAGGQFCFGPKVLERCQPTRVSRRGKAKRPRSKLDMLSPRETEVLRLIGRGMGRSEIAETLCRSPKTIDGHREAIMEKLDIHDRAELVRFAIREGLVEA